MHKKKHLFILLIVLLVSPCVINSMKRPQQTALLISKKKRIDDIHPFDLPFLIIQKIFSMNLIFTSTSSLKETTLALSSLSYTNKAYNTFFCNDKKTLEFIKHIASLYECSYMTVVRELQTKPAKKRYLLQNNLFANLNGTHYEFNAKHCDFLKKEGFDFEFTFDINNATALIIAAGQKSYSFQSLVTWLIENDANINATNKFDMTPIMVALRTMNYSVIAPLLNHQHIDIHKKDYNDNTLFHYLSMGFKQHHYSHGLTIDNLYKIWQILVNKGLDPKLANKEGKTALDLLSNEHTLQLIALIENE